eukprot:4075946-Pyramimonas_sp.AAC.1
MIKYRAVVQSRLGNIGFVIREAIVKFVAEVQRWMRISADGELLYTLHCSAQRSFTVRAMAAICADLKADAVPLAGE